MQLKNGKFVVLKPERRQAVLDRKLVGKSVTEAAAATTTTAAP